MTTRIATVRFCPECNNMLYPKEDRVNRLLLYACRNCEHQEEADHPCVYHHQIIKGKDETEHSTQDISSDPALPVLSKTCPVCDYNQAVFFQSRSRQKETSMTFNYVCCNPSCNHKWEAIEGA